MGVTGGSKTSAPRGGSQGHGNQATASLKLLILDRGICRDVWRIDQYGRLNAVEDSGRPNVNHWGSRREARESMRATWMPLPYRA